MKPLISVLVDTYNHEKYVEQTIVSVLEQDFPAKEYEIVVVDDGSTDRTPEIVRKFSPRVRLISKANGGQASAFNVALPDLAGEIVAILDGDDWFARRKLSAVMKVFEQNPEAGGVAHGFYEFYENTKEIRVRAPKSQNLLNLATPETAREALSWWQFLIVGSLTIRRTVLAKVLPISNALVFCADGPIAWAAIAAGVRVFEEPLCYYRLHSNNLHALEDGDDARMMKKSKMDSLMLEETEKCLLRMNINREALLALHHAWMENRRSCLRKYGSRLGTFRAEMRSFHLEHRKPGLGYSLFKYLVMGTATFLLPPSRFYEAREWYARRGWIRFRS